MPVSVRSQICNELEELLAAQLITDSLDSLSNDSDSDTSIHSASTNSSDDSNDSNDFLAPSELILLTLQHVHASRYLQERAPITKDGSLLRLTLEVWVTEQPLIFRRQVRVNPATFHALCDLIADDPVFQNNSQNAQIPVPQQLAVTLYRLGHFGNGVNMSDVGLWAGFGHGTVDRITRRVLTALNHPRVRKAAVRWPSAGAEREPMKRWVADTVCEAWHDGWVMVDGTLVPFARKPAHFGPRWFDRKCNYSLNVQIVNDPFMRIVDFSVGLPGSQHDSTAFKLTRAAQEHEHLLEPGEFIWADSAYPIQDWLVAPFKAPEKELPDNRNFNYHVSKVCAKSENAIGFLKGRCCSLKGLRVNINSPDHIRFAALWVSACIVVHSFALYHESVEEYDRDEFFRLGQEIMREGRGEVSRIRAHCESVARVSERQREMAREAELVRARAKRESLKAAWLASVQNDVFM